MKPRLRSGPPRLAVPEGRGEAERLKAREAARPNWYKTARWQKLRRAVFARDGYVCQATGELCVGTHPAPNAPVADHIRPHRWDPKLFWDPANIQTVTKRYHDSEKQRQERAGLRG